MKKNCSDFFRAKVPNAQKPALLEDGEQLSEALRVAAQPADLADRGRGVGDCSGSSARAPPNDRVVETYSHVAPEVEQRLLDGLEARWHAAQAYLHPRPAVHGFRTVLIPAGHWRSHVV